MMFVAVLYTSLHVYRLFMYKDNFHVFTDMNVRTCVRACMHLRVCVCVEVGMFVCINASLVSFCLTRQWFAPLQCPLHDSSLGKVCGDPGLSSCQDPPSAMLVESKGMQSSTLGTSAAGRKNGKVDIRPPSGLLS